jgi:hypothetical protein
MLAAMMSVARDFEGISMRDSILWCIGLFLVGACSPEDGNKNGLLSTRAGSSASGATTSGGGGNAGTAAAGITGTTVGPQAAVGGTAAGRGAAGVSSAATSGTGGMNAAQAGSSGQSAGGRSAGAGTTGTAGANSGTGGAMGAAGSGGNTAGTVTVEFATITYRGEYAPLNYLAVWFEDANAGFIKTAARWAGAAHATDLVAWTKASGGWGLPILGGGNQADQMDVMSAATRRNHQAQKITWNMKNTQMQLIPDGDYVAVVEMSESRATAQSGRVLHIPFKKGPAPQTVQIPDDASFTGVVLRYMP